MPAITIAISREQRDGIYELVRNDLGWAERLSADFAVMQRILAGAEGSREDARTNE